MDRHELDRLLMKPTARRRLGKYVVLGRLGHGGMGKIYLAYTPGPAGIEKLLVIKRLHSHLTHDPVLVNNFLDEARLSMALSHPNTVHTYDVGEVDGRYFMVMEYIDGQNLGVVLRAAKRSGQYPPSAFWGGLFLGVLDGLHAAHTASDARGRPLHIIHRDVSPQNVLVTYEGNPKLVDFGIAKATHRISETDAGVLKGKYAYMSPEQCRSQELDARSDVFAAGIVLWEMLAGRRLYKTDSVIKSVERILHETPLSPVHVNPACAPVLGQIAVKALQKQPDDRFHSAEDFRDAIDDALRQQGRSFRSSEARELMTRLFADVRARQGAILEACLSGQVAEDADHEIITAGHSDSSPGFQESGSIQVPNLALPSSVEPTTPSHHRVSPLITHDGEAPEARSAPTPHIELTDPAASDAVTRQGLTGAPVGVAVAGHTAASIEPRQAAQRSYGPIAAGVLVLAALALGVIWFVLPHDEAGPDHEALIGAPPPVQPAGPPLPPPVAPDGGSVPPAALVASPAQPPAQSESAGQSGGAGQQGQRPQVDTDVPSAPATAPPGPAKLVRAPRSRPPLRGGRPDEAPPRKSAAPTPALPSGRPTESAAKPTGMLTLETVPWTTVYLGKTKLGETPLVRVPIPAGDVELVLVNEAAGIRQPYVLQVKPGERYRRKLKLD